jgi:purine-nucleoside phosphorylase
MKTTSIEYRRPEPGHADGLFQLEQECFPSPWDIDEIKGLIRRDLSLYTLAAFNGDEPVGYVSAVFSEPGVLHIISICSSPSFRRTGIAGNLLSCALQWGRHLEANRVVLEVREGNLPAIGFYGTWGFNSVGTINNFYGIGINGVLMERPSAPIRGTLDALLFLNSRLSRKPRLGVILGSGLGWVAEQFGSGSVIPFEDIPGMAGKAVQGHAHTLHASEDGDIVFIMGRRHHYQGYSGREITLLPSALAALGVDRWLLTSSAGAVDPSYRVGDAMVFTDHFNFSGCIPDHPLCHIGKSVYSPSLRKMAEEELDRPRSGVFACVSGPAYETSAEVDFIRKTGCSAVSMSTAQEAMALRSLGCGVLAVALVTNAVDSGESVCHEEVLSAQDTLGKRQGKSLVRLIERLKS